MPIEIGDGNNIGSVFVGEDAIQKVYVGTDLVWEAVIVPTSGTLHFLVIAGGGGGNPGGGGAGAGGYRNSYLNETSGGNSATETGVTINAGDSFNITVGAGGTAAPVSSDTVTLSTTGSNGGNSTFGSITSIGGGRGDYFPQAGTGFLTSSGGSGGGAVFNPTDHDGLGTAGQGHAGHPGGVSSSSTWSGGGGGAGAAGNNTGTGGAGLSSSITGTSVNRGGGGSPGPWSGGSRGSNGFGGGASGGAGTVNTGGGGGGGGSTSQSQTTLRSAGNGGSGIVVLRYPSTFTGTYSAGLTVSTSTDGTDTVAQITAGTGTVTF